MDKKLILAVAGSGKTTYLVENIPKDKRSLVLTYTEANIINLRNVIIKKFGYFPNNICLKTYFSFLYSFCIQPFLKDECKLNGLIYKENDNRFAKGDTRYLTKKGNLFYNRAAKFAEIKGIYQDIQRRLEKYYQYLFIDEIQDFAGYDFNLLEKISCANINILYVGDFYQHTFDTSRDGNVRQNLHDNYDNYKKCFKNLNISPDENTLIKSYRCSPKVCKYITDNLEIKIESHGDIITEIKYIDCKNDIENIVKNDKIIKLFYKQHYLYKCKSRNWGDCKGEDKYNDVCVVLNKKTLDYYLKDILNELLPQTRNKLYVAISRARGNIYFIAEKNMENYKIKG
jgi:DNA helicase-2/ATP-dependent DNA helicase PcrA